LWLLCRSLWIIDAMLKQFPYVLKSIWLGGYSGYQSQKPVSSQHARSVELSILGFLGAWRPGVECRSVRNVMSLLNSESLPILVDRQRRDDILSVTGPSHVTLQLFVGPMPMTYLVIVPCRKPTLYDVNTPQRLSLDAPRQIYLP
jgi:hypothetical protein